MRHTTTCRAVIPHDASWRRRLSAVACRRSTSLRSSTRRRGCSRSRPFTGQPFGVGRISLRTAPRHAARAAGHRRDRTRREARPGAVSGARQSGLRQSDEGIPRRQHAAHLRRAGARAGGRHAAGNPRSAAADHPLFPLPRRRAAGTVARSSQRDSAGASCRATIRLAHRRLLQLWWKQYAKPAGLFEPKPDYPPVVDNYLTTTLARRLNLRLPRAEADQVGLCRTSQGVGA